MALCLKSALALAEYERCGMYAILHTDPPTPYYCACHDGIPFTYGLEMEIADTTWFGTTIDQVIKGVNAYWFSDVPVAVEVYAFCTSDTATAGFVVTPNNNLRVDTQFLLDQIGADGKSMELLKQMEVHIRAYPIGGGKGQFYGYDYQGGFHSTCDKLFDIFYKMPYVTSSQDNVYRLKATEISQGSPLFVKWTQDDLDTMYLSVAYDCAQSQVLQSAMMFDSTRVCFIRQSILDSARIQGKDLYFSVNTKAAGAVQFYRYANYSTTALDTTICAGLGLDLGDTVLTTSTRILDTTCVSLDNLLITNIKLTVTPADTVFDTISLKSTDLRKQFYHGELIREFGTMNVTVHQKDQCDENYQLLVNHDYTVKRSTVDTTLCKGMRYTHPATRKSYTSNVTLRDTTYSGSDTQIITTTRVKFVLQPAESDTLYLYKTQLPYTYESKKINAFGDFTFTITKTNTCTRTINVHVVELTKPVEYQLATTVDTTVCLGRALEIGNAYYTTEGVYNDTTFLSEQADKVIMLVTPYSLSVAKPELEYDTLTIHRDSLPIIVANTNIAEAGDYRIYMTEENTCDRDVMLTVETFIICGEPVITFDTIAPAELPVDYQGNIISTYGEQEIWTKDADGCDLVTHLNVEPSSAIGDVQTEISADAEVRAFTATGQMVYTGRLGDMHLNHGVYLLRINNQQQLILKKLLVP